LVVFFYLDAEPATALYLTHHSPGLVVVGFTALPT
jgi:hypothetical protein